MVVSDLKAFALAFCLLIGIATSANAQNEPPPVNPARWNFPASTTFDGYGDPDAACRAMKDLFGSWGEYQPPEALAPTVFQCRWTQGGPLPTAVILGCREGKLVMPGICLIEARSEPECEPCSGTSEQSGPPTPTVGNPMSAQSGAKIQTERDYSSADGLLVVERQYRSRMRGLQPMADGGVSFGSTWQGLIPGRLAFGGPHADYAEYYPNSGSIAQFAIYTWQDENNFAYKMDGNGRLQLTFIGAAPDGRTAYFASSPGTAPDFRLTFATGDYILYRRAGGEGLPVQHVLANGYVRYFDYNGTFKNGVEVPYQVRDNFGRVLALTWAEPKMGDVSTLGGPVISQIGLPDGTLLSYTYDMARLGTALGRDDRLASVRRLTSVGAQLWKRNYLYEDPRNQFLMTGITDQNDARLSTYTYNAAAQVALTERAGGIDRYRVTHEYDGYNARYWRTVTNSLGRQERYTINIGTRTTVPYPIMSIDGLASANVPADSVNYGYEGSPHERVFVNSTSDKRGLVTTLINDPVLGRPLSVTEAAWTSDARTTTRTWHPTLDLLTSEARTGLTTSYTYSPEGRMLTRTQTDTTTHTLPYSTQNQVRTWTYTWTGTGKIASVNGPKAAAGALDDKVTYAYDTAGNVTSITNGLNQVTTFAGYDGNGRPTTMTDPNAVVTAFVYDGLGRTSSVTVRHPTNTALHATTSFDYDVEGRVTGITRPATEKLIVDYDLAGRVTAIRTNSGDRVDYDMNAMGGVLSETVKTTAGTIRNTVTRTFDELNRMLTLTLGPGRTTTWAYDKNDNPVQVTSPRSNAATMAFDGLDRLVSTIAPAAGTVTDAYDVRDNPVSHTDAVAVTTTYVRNGFGETIQETSPDRGTTVYYYNVGGELVGRTDGRGQRVNYTRDMLGRILTRVPVGVSGQNMTYTYDTGGIAGGYGIGRLSKVVDPSGTTSFQYDHRGNMTIKRQKIGTTTSANLSYTYDLADRIVTMTYPSGRIANYVRDGRGRVTAVTTKATSTAALVTLASAIAYEPYGALKLLNYGNTLKLENDWGSDARLVSRAVRRVSDNGVVWGAGYGYDNDDNVTQVTDMADVSRVVSYEYDAASRLTRATGSYGATRQYDYAFDANGNRTRVETRNVAGSPSPDAAVDYTRTSGTNRLASLSGAETRTISYDGRGNTSGEVRPAATASLTYDAHGRLTGYARTGEATQANVYNGLEDRVQVTRTSGTADVRRYLFDGTGRLIGDYGANATDVKGEFVWLLPEAANDNGASGLQGDMDDGAGGWMPLAVMTGSGTATVIRYLHGDRLGVPVATTSTTGAITTPGTYAELQFPGQIKTLADVYYNRHRDYDPGTGRYVQADPIGLEGGANIYLYAKANPLRFTDPSGRFVPAAIIGGIILGAAADLAWQALDRWGAGKSIWDASCYNWAEVGLGGAAGAFGGGWATALKVTKGSWKYKNVSRRIRRANSVESGDDLHHGFLPRHWENALWGRAARFVNHPMNLKVVPRQLHKEIHNKMGVLEGKWTGAPTWSKSAFISVGSGSAAELGDD
jgi:RHS repeat-associated protein